MAQRSFKIQDFERVDFAVCSYWQRGECRLQSGGPVAHVFSQGQRKVCIHADRKDWANIIQKLRTGQQEVEILTAHRTAQKKGRSGSPKGGKDDGDEDQDAGLAAAAEPEGKETASESTKKSRRAPKPRRGREPEENSVAHGEVDDAEYAASLEKQLRDADEPRVEDEAWQTVSKKKRAPAPPGSKSSAASGGADSDERRAGGASRPPAGGRGAVTADTRVSGVVFIGGVPPPADEAEQRRFKAELHAFFEKLAPVVELELLHPKNPRVKDPSTANWFGYCRYDDDAVVERAVATLNRSLLINNRPIVVDYQKMAIPTHSEPRKGKQDKEAPPTATPHPTPNVTPRPSVTAAAAAQPAPSPVDLGVVDTPVDASGKPVGPARSAPTPAAGAWLRGRPTTTLAANGKADAAPAQPAADEPKAEDGKEDKRRGKEKGKKKPSPKPTRAPAPSAVAVEGEPAEPEAAPAQPAPAPEVGDGPPETMLHEPQPIAGAPGGGMEGNMPPGMPTSPMFMMHPPPGYSPPLHDGPTTPADGMAAPHPQMMYYPYMHPMMAHPAMAHYPHPGMTEDGAASGERSPGAERPPSGDGPGDALKAAAIGMPDAGPATDLKAVSFGPMHPQIQEFYNHSQLSSSMMRPGGYYPPMVQVPPEQQWMLHQLWMQQQQQQWAAAQAQGHGVFLGPDGRPVGPDGTPLPPPAMQHARPHGMGPPIPGQHMPGHPGQAPQDSAHAQPMQGQPQPHAMAQQMPNGAQPLAAQNPGGAASPTSAALNDSSPAEELGFVGLKNAQGDNLCWVNAIVQSLARLRGVRQEFHAQLKGHKHAGEAEGELCLVCQLAKLMDDLVSSPKSGSVEERLTAAPVREALGAVFDRAKFKRGEMSDAAEALRAMLNHIHETLAVAPSGPCVSPPCVAHRCFALEMVETARCICGGTSEPRSYVSFSLDFNTSVFSTVLKTQEPGAGFDALLRAMSNTESRKCTERDCVRTNPVTRQLLNTELPSVLTIEIGWASANATKDEISTVVGAIVPEIDLGVIIEGVGGRTPCSLRAMVAFTDKHYMAVVRDEETRHWMALNDADVTDLGGRWVDVVSWLHRGNWQPVLLFYEGPSEVREERRASEDPKMSFLGATIKGGAPTGAAPRVAAPVRQSRRKEPKDKEQQGAAEGGRSGSRKEEDAECFNCGRTGHISKDCTASCQYCGGGHWSNSCPNRDAQKPDQCYNCKQRGHRSKACPAPCQHCGKTGHWSHKCSQAPSR